MNVKSKKLIGALAALVLLVGAYIAAQEWQKKKAGVGRYNPSYTEGISLTDFRVVDVVRLEIPSSGLILVKNNNVWELEYPKTNGVFIEQYAVSGRLWSISNLEAQKMIEENAEDLSQYGLDDPRGRAIITDIRGRTVELNFGNLTPDRVSYYVMVKGDPKVYTAIASSVENIIFALDDIRRKELLPDFEPYSLARMIIENSGTKIEIIPNDNQNYLVSSFSSFTMTSPYKFPRGADVDKFGAILKLLPELRIDEFVDNEPASLAPYGLDKPGRFYVEGPGHYLDLRFGYGTDEKLYVKFADVPTVFTVMHLDEIVSTKPFAIVDKFAHIYNIKSVDQFTVSGEGRTLRADITHKGEDEDEDFFINGRKAADSEFRTYYQSVIALMADAEYPGPQGRTDTSGQDITITFNLSEPAGAVYSAVLSPYNRDFYSYNQYGFEEFLISRNQVRRIFDTVDKVVYE